MENIGISVVATKVKDVLVVTLPNDLSDENFNQLKIKVVNGLSSTEVRAVVFECSALQYIDHYEFIDLKNLLDSSRILGAKPILVSLSPGIIKYLIESDVDLTGIKAFLSLNEALDFLEIN